MRPADAPLDPANALQHAPWMAALARHLARGDAGTDDLLQDTWLAYLSHPPRDPRATGSWLRKVLTNFAMGSRRSEARRRAREESAARPEADPADPAGVVERAELLQRISELVLRLEEPYRSTVLLRYFEDLPPAEIARREKVPINTVYTRLRRALEDLRKRLDAAHGGNRSLWLVVLAPLAVVPLAPAGAMAAPASLSSSSIGKLLVGGIPLASKKIGVAVALSACFFLAVGSLVLWTHSSSRRSMAGGVDSSAAARLQSERRASNADLTAPPDSPVSGTAQPAQVTEAPAPAKAPLLRGRVLDARGSGIAGAEVVALPLRLWEGRTAADLRTVDRAGDRDLTDEIGALLRRFRAAAADLPRARSGPAGEFRFESLVDGEHRLLARCDGYLPSTKTVVAVADPQTTVSDLELADAQTLRGRVVDPQKKPVAEAAVRSLPVSWRRLGDFERRQAILSFLGEARFLAEATEARSGPDGAFSVTSLEPGLHDLLASKEGFGHSALFDVPAGPAAVELVLPLGLSVTGVVLGVDRKPVAGAGAALVPCLESRRPAVAVGEPSDSTVRAEVLFENDGVIHAVTDARGRFELAGASAGRHVLGIRAQGFPALSQDVDLHESADLGVLTLKVGGSIAGIVLDPGGSAVSGARVWIEDVAPEGVPEWGGRFYTPGSLVETRARADGRFRMEGLRDGGYTVHAAAAIWLERSLSGIQPGREDLRIELSEGFAARGRVIDGADGTALTGASVTVKRGLQPAPEKGAYSGPGGRFEIKGLAWGDERLVLEASHPAYPGENASMEVREDLRSDEVVLRLFHAEPLSGRVLDPAGKPIESARVGCTIAGVESFRTGEDGAFVLLVPRSARNYDGFEVAATHAASGSGRVVVEKPAEGLSWPKVSMVLRPGSDLRGKVKDSSGRPVSRATVRASRLPGKGQQGRGAPETAYSGDDGGYVFRRLEEGTYRLEAEALGYARAALEGVEVNETNQDQDLVLEPGRKLAGRVVDQDGRAVSAAEVVALEALDLDASSDHGTGPTRWNRRHEEAGMASARTDAKGTYLLLDLPAGRLTLVARAPGCEPSALVVVPPDESPSDLTVTLLGSLSGTVENAANGQPLSPFVIWLGMEDDEDGSQRSLLPRDYDDPAGAFHFEALRAGHYAVAVVVPRRPISGHWIDVRPGEETTVQFRLETGVSLTGVVKDADGGAPVAGARVMAAANGWWADHLTLPTPYSAWSAADGSFRIEGLGPARYHLYIYRSDFAPKEKTVEVRAGEDPAPLEIALRRSGRLEGRLVNLTKRKAISTSILLRRLDEPGKEPERHSITGRSEDFALEGIRPGRYEVQLHEEVLGPRVAPDATAFKTEDMVERTVPLGEVEIRVGETARFEAAVPIEREGGG